VSGLTVTALLDRTVTKHASRLAFVDERERITYEGLYLRAARVANALAGLGVKKGDRVAASLANSVEFATVHYGAALLGAVLVPCNPMLLENELAFVYNDCEPVAVFAQASLLPQVTSGAAKAPAVKHVIGVGAPSEQGLSFGDLVGSASSQAPTSRPADDDLLSILYTSGTTGRPKGAMLTHNNVVWDAERCAEAIAIVETDNFLCVLPMFHSFAITTCIYVPAVVGCRATILERFTPRTCLDAIAQEKCTVFPGVAPMFALLIRSKAEADVSSLRLAVAGGAPLPPPVALGFEEAFGIPLLEGDGPTECGPATAINPPKGTRKLGSIGLPLRGVEIRIFDENDREVPVNEIGEIVVRGPNVMKGYWNLPEATAEALRNGWMHTGDLGKIDEDGYVYIVDRKKDMIIVSGINVYPREVEDILMSHPKVALSAVIGVPDETKGEEIKAVLQLKEGETATPQEIIRFCAERMAAFKVPRYLEFRDQLPLTGTGKVFKRALREETQQKS